MAAGDALVAELGIVCKPISLLRAWTGFGESSWFEEVAEPRVPSEFFDEDGSSSRRISGEDGRPRVGLRIAEGGTT